MNSLRHFNECNTTRKFAYASVAVVSGLSLLTGCVAALPLIAARRDETPAPAGEVVVAAPAVTTGPTKTVVGSEPSAPLTAERKAATTFTIAKNQAVYDEIDFANEQEVEFAERGLIAAPDHLELKDADGNVIWSQRAFEFIESSAPDTANPSLWRNTQLNHNYGLFQVADGIYQVRGYDVSNLTLIEGETGWIIFDPLTNVETAKAALHLANDNLGERPVVGVVISHSHGDHFGGIRGVLPEDADVPIIVPDGFMEHAVAENIYAGNAMNRRANFMYGSHLEPGADGRLGVGLGVGVPLGTSSFVPPNDIITQTGQTRTIDGVEMVFQLTPGTEAPAEMNTWFPQKHALWVAENCTTTLHNLYTLRGAQVRDGNAWANYLMETVALWGDDVEVTFQAHNWPHWGNEYIDEYLVNTAAAYKYLNDQSLLYLNQGYTSAEIAEMISIPSDIATYWYLRPYYGTPKHNSKAVYQKFMGWYDANPAHLDPLPLSESASKFVEYMGDPAAVLEKAKADFANGEYRWVAEVTNILVFADPTNTEARYLCADALEQLGYQAESGVWRAAYLTGAQELREGQPQDGGATHQSGQIVQYLTPPMVFDYLGINVDSNKVEDLNGKINIDAVGGQPYLLTIKSGVVLYQEGVSDPNADLTITLPAQAIPLLLSPDIKTNENVQFDGDITLLDRLHANMAERVPNFNIIEQ